MTQLEQSEGRLPVPIKPGADATTTKKPPILFGLLAGSVIVILIALRLIHLGADTPSWVSPDAGAYIDEGYKTLSARNLVVYGKTHWDPFDNYPGWMKSSPIPSWSYYAAFRLFSPCLDAARGVSICYFTLFLLVWFVLFRKRYALPILLAGLLLVGLDPGLFFYSRLALLEVPMIFGLYGFLLFLARYLEDKLWVPVIFAIGISPLLAFGIKLTALIYLAPVIGVLLLRALFQEHSNFGFRLGVVGTTAIIAVLLAFVTERTWMARLDVDPLQCVRKFLTNPLATTSPFLFLAGWLCGIHLVVRRPSHVLASSFRTALMGLGLLGPLLIALFSYDPDRYFVPLIPAYALIICEWLAAQKGALNEIEISRPAAAIMIIGLAAWVVFTVVMIGRFGLPLLNGMVAAPHWIQGGMKVGLGFLLSLALTLAFYLSLGKKLLDTRKVAMVLGVFVTFQGAYSMLRLGGFLLSPTYQGNLVRTQIVGSVPEGSSLIGDWAPFFALGTNLHPLYMCPQIGFNPPNHLVQLHPHYFLDCDTPTSRLSLAEISKLNEVTLGPAILTTEYNHKKVILYPLRFNVAMAATKDRRMKNNMR